MSKLQWSANGFARRVQMGAHDLWIIVEGRDHDRPHYDTLVKKLPATRGLKAQIRLAEQVHLAGVSAGGKQHAMAIHDHLAAIGKLVQANSTRAVRVVFMVDRDRDDFNGTLSPSPHVMYTVGTDIETDILLNSDLWGAVRAAYGIDTSLSKRVKRRVANPAAGLATLWADWLRLGLVGIACGVPGCAPWAQLSRVNVAHFGPLDGASVHHVESALLAAAPSGYAAANRQAIRHVGARRELLLKGRWIARYVNHLVQTHLAGEIVRAVAWGVVIDTALARLKYTGDWVLDYNARFSSLLSST